MGRARGDLGRAARARAVPRSRATRCPPSRAAKRSHRSAAAQRTTGHRSLPATTEPASVRLVHCGAGGCPQSATRKDAGRLRAEVWRLLPRGEPSGRRLHPMLILQELIYSSVIKNHGIMQYMPLFQHIKPNEPCKHSVRHSTYCRNELIHQRILATAGP